jgi:hypothetical protein
MTFGRWRSARRRDAVSVAYGQTWPKPAGDLKQPTQPGNTLRGSQRRTLGTTMVKAMAAKKSP